MLEVENIEIYGPPKERRAGVITFNLGDVHAHDVATAVDTEGVAVRVPHAHESRQSRYFPSNESPQLNRLLVQLKAFPLRI